jgi:hypothetical protein
MAVIAGKAGIRCYYCDSALRYEGAGLAIGGDVVPAQGVPIASYDYDLIVQVAGPEDRWNDYFNSYAQGAGFTEARNPAGDRAFGHHRKQDSSGGSS